MRGRKDRDRESQTVSDLISWVNLRCKLHWKFVIVDEIICYSFSKFALATHEADCSWQVTQDSVPLGVTRMSHKRQKISGAVQKMLKEARVARLATLDAKSRRPHIVPVCFVYTASFSTQR